MASSRTNKKTTTSKSTGTKRSTRTTKTKEEKAREKEEQRILAEQYHANLIRKKQMHDDIMALVIIMIGLFFIISLFTDTAGKLGAILKTVLFGIFGKVSFAIAIFFILFGILVFAKKTALITMKTWISMIALFVCSASLFAVKAAENIDIFNIETIKNLYEAQNGGGVLGTGLAYFLYKSIGAVGLYLASILIIVVCAMFIFNTPLSAFLDNLKMKAAANRKVREEREAALALAQAQMENEVIEPEVFEPTNYNPVPEEPDFANSLSEIETIGSMDREPDVIYEPVPKKSVPKQEQETVKEDPVKEAESPKLDLSPMKEFTRESIGLKSSPVAPDADISDNQRKILEMVTSDSLFSEKRQGKAGFGLNGDKIVHMTMPKEEEKPIVDENGVETFFAPVSGFDKLDNHENEQTTEQPADAPVNTASRVQEVTYREEVSAPEIKKEEPPKHMSAFEAITAAKQLSKEEKEIIPDPEKSQQIAFTETTESIPEKVSAAAEPSVQTSANSAANTQSERSAEAAAPAEPPKPEYEYPPITLLNKPNNVVAGSNGDLGEQAQLLENTLNSFGVKAKVIDVVRGPAVTRFEVQPAVGVKVSSITHLSDDLALNLRAKSLRIEAPIPGKAAVGVEISNATINTVTLREIIDSKEFSSAKAKITVGLGRSVAGEPVVANLKDMPHLLIAGATGSGKSVCINSLLVSLLYKAKPEEVKIMLIDPKVVELSVYNGIPHLLAPVVTDPAKAAAALNWAVAEMNNRYDKFANEGVRDLNSYNETVRANGEDEKVLPQIVIVIDELADLIMAAKSNVEDSICRIAQKARAAGMYLIIATQRPSVDVITGVIEANIPSRIAFAVSSQVDSRTILDMGGAEMLLGKGDMLYFPQGISKPLRVQGCYVSDKEVMAVINFVKENAAKMEAASEDGPKPDHYASQITNAINNAGAGAQQAQDNDEDELLTDAIECVVRAEQASVSMLQRRFRIGYNRAARLIDIMEERGIVGPADGARARKVNMTVQQFETLMNGEDDEVPEEI